MCWIIRQRGRGGAHGLLNRGRFPHGFVKRVAGLRQHVWRWHNRALLQHLDALLFQQALHTLDRIAFIVKELADRREQTDIGRAVEAAAAGSLSGLIWGNLVSQKRKTCWGRSRSSAASLMVLNASALLSIEPLLQAV